MAGISIARGGVRQEPGSEPPDAPSIEVVHDHCLGCDAGHFAHEVGSISGVQVVQDERGVDDVEGSVVSINPIRWGQPHLDSLRARLGHPSGRQIHDLRAYVGRDDSQPHSGSICAPGKVNRNVGSACADIEHPQRRVAVGSKKRFQSSPGEVDSAEPAIDSSQIAQIRNQRLRVQRTVEELRGSRLSPHWTSVLGLRKTLVAGLVAVM